MMTAKKRKFYEKRNASMVESFEKEGLSIPEIAEKYGLKVQRAYMIIKKSRAYIEKMVKQRRDFRKEREKIYWLSQHGYKTDEIAKRYGMKMSHVYNVVYQIRNDVKEKADWKNSCVPVEIIDRETGKVVASYKNVREASIAMYFNYSGICRALKAYPNPIGGWFGEKYLARKAETNAGKLHLMSEEELDEMIAEDMKGKEKQK